MSLSRLPQVALRRLMPAISAVPKSLDDDQLKKILDPQQQTTASILAKSSLPAKAELAAAMSTTTQGIISALAKSSPPSSTTTLGRLMMNLSGGQGVLSTQDLALLRAANSISSSFYTTAAAAAAAGEASLLTTPEPGSPAPDHLLAIDSEPIGGTLDSASVDDLVSALRGTVAISASASSDFAAAEYDGSAASPSGTPGYRQATATVASSKRGGGSSVQRHDSAAALEEHHQIASSVAEDDDVYFDQSDDDLTPISADLSAAERRKEQNRRAQKKFRQKDKVRQKEIKWRASQYEDLVESNKRFKRDIDSISQERDMYRRILEQNGINLGGDIKPSIAARPEAVASSSRARRSSPPMPSLSPPSPALLSSGSLGMDQIAQDTYGTISSGLPPTAATVSMNDLLSSLMFGAVKADPMFGASSAVGLFGPGGAAHRSVSSGSAPSMTTYPSLASSATTIGPSYAQSMSSLLDSLSSTAAAAPEPLYAESPGMIDHHVVDAPYAQHVANAESQFVDPMAFIDELLATSSSSSACSPGFSPMPESPLFSPMSMSSSGSISRKRSYDNAMF
ncbi:hypothetical protein GGF44_002597 [Coemansia sp. RSA 1694]|nr:hypothetical protein GGF44_002597 [Coemansia sp. RSA 1694]